MSSSKRHIRPTFSSYLFVPFHPVFDLSIHTVPVHVCTLFHPLFSPNADIIHFSLSLSSLTHPLRCQVCDRCGILDRIYICTSVYCIIQANEFTTSKR